MIVENSCSFPKMFGHNMSLIQQIMSNYNTTNQKTYVTLNMTNTVGDGGHSVCHEGRNLTRFIISCKR